MGLKSEVTENARRILSEPFALDRIIHVPALQEQALEESRKYRKFDATVLQVEVRMGADFFGGKEQIACAARVQKLYIETIQRIAKSLSGEVRGMRSEEVLIFFPGTTKAMVSNAVRCAMNLVYIFSDEENELYQMMKESEIMRPEPLEIGIGLDYGAVVCMKMEQDEAKFLLWSGSPVHRAIALSRAAGADSRIIVSKYVCDNLLDRVKYYRGESMWKPMEVNIGGKMEACWFTNFQWSFD